MSARRPPDSWRGYALVGAVVAVIVLATFVIAWHLTGSFPSD